MLLAIGVVGGGGIQITILLLQLIYAVDCGTSLP
jgi:hypothetical protein